MTEWQRMFAAATRGKKSFPERAAAVREAAARYRGGGRAGARRSRARRNPSGGNWLPWVLIGGAALVAFNVMKGQKPAAPAGK